MDEVNAVMAAALKGEIAEADAVRTIIILQREVINALISHNTHSQTGTAGTAKDGGASLTSEAA